jgi:V-type H+-transporting ATPase subunit d
MLSLEADRHAIRITVNSFGTELSKFDRQSLYANFGNLHPIGQGRLVHCESLEEVRDILSSCPEYSGLANITSFHDIDRRLHVLELGNCHQAFELQFNFAIFYAFAKLQENELNNLMWLCECISQQQKGNLEEGLVHVGN